MATKPISNRTRAAIAGLFATSIFSAHLTAQYTMRAEDSVPSQRELRGARGAAARIGQTQSEIESVAAPGVQNREVVLHAFDVRAPQGFEPEAGLVSDAAGNFYTSAYNFGPMAGQGVILKVDRWGNVSVLYAFTGGKDGGNPTGSLIVDGAGNLYGTTLYGGNVSACTRPVPGCGVIFKIDPFGRETVLYAFKGASDGALPFAPLTLDKAGNLYGATLVGGNTGALCAAAGGCGVIFKLDKAGMETPLYTFTGGSDGAQPNGGLIFDAAGSLYGTTRYGGNNIACSSGTPKGCGVVFKLDKAGIETVLHTFNGSPDGAFPFASVTMDTAGNLYGNANGGGYASGACAARKGCGIVFKLDKAGNETVLRSFMGDANGAVPGGALIMDSAGNLYGNTIRGGNLTVCTGGSVNGCGVIFKMDKTGNETVLHTFTSGADGALPNTSPLLDKTGRLRGTTTAGGLAGFGAIYALDPDGYKTEYSVYGLPSSTRGSNPFAGVIFDSAGNLYGATELGGTYNSGVAFKLDKYGNETVLHKFTGGADGAFPAASFALDNAGNVYGTAAYGGNLSAAACPGYGCGVVYKIDKFGKQTVLYTFQGGNDGANPGAGVILDAAGNLYGTAQFSGANGAGVVFKLDKLGKQTVLYAFQGTADGANPNSKLAVDNAGNLYGTTFAGGNLSSAACSGAGGCGVVFKLDKSGKETALYTFGGGADGAAPSAEAGLIFDSANNLYGTASAGGNVSVCPDAYPTAGCGVVFKLDQAGKETVLYTFKGAADGATPSASLIFDGGGSLYGTASGGGTLNPAACFAGCGVVFRLDKAGNESVLYAFKGGADGGSPNAGLIFDNTGNLYSTAPYSGRFSSGGVVYKITRE